MTYAEPIGVPLCSVAVVPGKRNQLWDNEPAELTASAQTIIACVRTELLLSNRKGICCLFANQAIRPVRPDRETNKNSRKWFSMNSWAWLGRVGFYGFLRRNDFISDERDGEKTMKVLEKKSHRFCCTGISARLWRYSIGYLVPAERDNPSIL